MHPSTDAVAAEILPAALDRSPIFGNDQEAVDRWANLDRDSQREAVNGLSLNEVRRSVEIALEVAREHERRAEQARTLAAALRDYARMVADFEPDVPGLPSQGKSAGRNLIDVGATTTEAYRG